MQLEKIFEVLFRVISIVKNQSANSFLIQSEPLAREPKHMTAPTNHRMHYVRSHTLVAFRHWVFHYENKLGISLRSLREYR